MITSELTFRVRYNEVDRMGYAHHGNYAAYFEMGRTELMRNYGIAYKDMEDSGVILPLSEFHVKYFQPALYDDELRLVTTLDSFLGVRLNFTYKIYNKNNQLLAEGQTLLVFVSSLNHKPIRPPEYVIQKLESYFR